MKKTANKENLEEKLREWKPGEKIEMIRTIYGNYLPAYAWYVFEANGNEDVFKKGNNVLKEINAQVQTPFDFGSIELYTHDDFGIINEKEIQKYQKPYILRIRNPKNIPEELNFGDYHATLSIVCDGRNHLDLDFANNTIYFSNWTRTWAKEKGMKVKIRK